MLDRGRDQVAEHGRDLPRSATGSTAPDLGEVVGQGVVGAGYPRKSGG